LCHCTWVLAFLVLHVAVAGGLSVWQKLGVQPGSAQMARLDRFTAGRNVFSDDELLERRHAVLRDSLGQEAARMMLLRHPLLLTHDLEVTLRPKLLTLHALLPGVNICHAVLRAPALLQLSADATLAPRLDSLEDRLGTREAAIRAISRSPTLLNLRDVDGRYERLRAALPGLSASDLAKVVSQRPELLAFNDSSIQAKASALAELFGVADASRIIKRDSRVLTFHPSRLASKVAALEETLPGVDVRKMLARAPSLLSADVDGAIPRKLVQLAQLLPSVDVGRLVAQAPQLLEYDVQKSLAPRFAQMRELFSDPSNTSATPGAAAAAASAAAAFASVAGYPAGGGRPAPGAAGVRALASSKLLKQRIRPASIPKRRTRVGSESRRDAAGAGPRAGAQALAVAAVRAAPHRPPSVLGLLRLAALDIAVVRARMHRLKQLLPEEKVELMVRRCAEEIWAEDKEEPAKCRGTPPHLAERSTGRT
jgi:hypothetical protein